MHKSTPHFDGSSFKCIRNSLISNVHQNQFTILYVFLGGCNKFSKVKIIFKVFRLCNLLLSWKTRLKFYRQVQKTDAINMYKFCRTPLLNSNSKIHSEKRVRFFPPLSRWPKEHNQLFRQHSEFLPVYKLHMTVSFPSIWD